MKPSGKIPYDVMLEEISIGLYRIFNVMFKCDIEYNLIFYKKDNPSEINYTGNFSDESITMALTVAQEKIKSGKGKTRERLVTIEDE